MITIIIREGMEPVVHFDGEPQEVCVVEKFDGALFDADEAVTRFFSTQTDVVEQIEIQEGAIGEARTGLYETDYRDDEDNPVEKYTSKKA